MSAFKLGAQVVTTDPLEACAGYEPEARAERRPGAQGLVVGGGQVVGGERTYRVRHLPDGTEAVYDEGELLAAPVAS